MLRRKQLQPKRAINCSPKETLSFLKNPAWKASGLEFWAAFNEFWAAIWGDLAFHKCTPYTYTLQFRPGPRLQVPEFRGALHSSRSPLLPGGFWWSRACACRHLNIMPWCSKKPQIGPIDILWQFSIILGAGRDWRTCFTCC